MHFVSMVQKVTYQKAFKVLKNQMGDEPCIELGVNHKQFWGTYYLQYKLPNVTEIPKFKEFSRRLGRAGTGIMCVFSKARKSWYPVDESDLARSLAHRILLLTGSNNIGNEQNTMG